jgi:poly-gamma-glutamate capsule biosynthesis protein CapA/YwtB (metallophosphatase superfamily)
MPDVQCRPPGRPAPLRAAVLAGLAAVAVGAGGRAAAAATPTPAPPTPADGVLTVAWAGDTHFGRWVAEGLARPGGADPFRAVRNDLGQADLRVANLEGQLTAAPRVMGLYDLTGSPVRAGLLAAAGLDLVDVANNHATDHGRAGLVESLASLHAAGVATVGGGATRAAAWAPVVVTRRGLRLGVLACNAVPGSLGAADSAAGVAPCTEKEIVGAVQALRPRVDVLVVLPHWGVEYQAAPSRRQRQLAQALVAAGADAVIGHHPHVVEPVEWLPRPGRAPALVAYSLGNFLFDAQEPDTQRGLLLYTRLTRTGVAAFRALPIHTDWRGVAP